MSQPSSLMSLSTYSLGQYLLYAFVGFIIWLSGVIIVRIVGVTVFSADSMLLLVFFALAIPIAFVNMIIPRYIFRLPMKEMMIPALVMVAITLLLDGLSITFTDIYSSDSEMAMLVAGWLLWSFGGQVAVSLWLIGRANTP